MFNEARYAFRLWRLQKQKRSLRAWYSKKDSELRQRHAQEHGERPDRAQALKNHEELSSLTSEEMFEVHSVDDDISRLQTTFLLEQAARYCLPRPAFKTGSEDAAWEEATTRGGYHLKDVAIAELRASIRRERKERRERWQSWIPLITGLAGTLIGIISVLKK